MASHAITTRERNPYKCTPAKAESVKNGSSPYDYVESQLHATSHTPGTRRCRRTKQNGKPHEPGGTCRSVHGGLYNLAENRLVHFSAVSISIDVVQTQAMGDKDDVFNRRGFLKILVDQPSATSRRKGIQRHGNKHTERMRRNIGFSDGA